MTSTSGSAPIGWARERLASALQLPAEPTVVQLGLGVTGQATLRALSSGNAGGGSTAGGYRVTGMDSRGEVAGLAALSADCPDAELVLGRFDVGRLAQADLIVATPGLANLECLLTKVRTRARTTGRTQPPLVLSDIDLFALVTGRPVLAVTGTNGKSTVVSLLEHLLRVMGEEASAGGNLGTAALSLLPQDRDAEPDAYVLELSSFQLELTDRLHPQVAAILNVSEDHLDRHGSMPSYLAAKRRIHAGAGAIVINRADAATAPVDAAAHKARIVSFGLDQPPADGFGLISVGGAEWLAYGAELLLPARACSLPGRHNLANALAALAILHAGGWPWRRAVAGLKFFPGLPHRFVTVPSSDGVRWINDSKATNVDATRAALSGLAQGERCVLIVGGDAKDADLTPLAPVIRARVKLLVTIGRDGERFAALIGDQDPDVAVMRCSGLDEAVPRIARRVSPGDTVLMAPACASLDQFANYQARGDAFAALVVRHAVAGPKRGQGA